MTRIDYSGAAAAYRAARTLPPEVMARWDATMAAAGLPPARRVLDLGAGPGGFLGALARWSGAPVVAVEPQAAMRAEAVAAGTAARHPYAAGWGEALPLRAACVDWAWLSTVVHQLDDRDRAATELARVLRPGGVVLLRGFLSDVQITGAYRLFPGHERVAATFPSTADVLATFERAGFAPAGAHDVAEPWRLDPDSWEERVRSVRHKDSALRHYTDDEFDEGVARITARLAGGPVPNDVTLRLVVLALPG
ncbi:MAG TPA: class I SAM-dependent methyltransferase [Acidimicrobiales bacterium]|nr:class I SAM-dependent methyltransferase [Acidimicrobiales bacterium]